MHHWGRQADVEAADEMRNEAFRVGSGVTEAVTSRNLARRSMERKVPIYVNDSALHALRFPLRSDLSIRTLSKARRSADFSLSRHLLIDPHATR